MQRKPFVVFAIDVIDFSHLENGLTSELDDQRLPVNIVAVEEISVFDMLSNHAFHHDL